MLACTTIAAPALVVVPLGGVDAGFHAAVKLAVLLGAASALAIASRRCRDLGREEALLGVFAVLVVLSTAFASRLADGAAAIGCAIGLCSIARSSRAVLRGQWSIVEEAVAWAAAGTAAIALLELAGVRLPWAELRRPESTIGNRNQLAGLLTIMLPVLVGAALRGRRFAAPVIAITTCIVVVSHCRSAYLAAIAALVVSCVGYARHRRAIDRRRVILVVGVLALGVVLGVMPWPGVEFGPSVLDSAGRVLEYETGSGHARVVQHELAVSAFVREPSALLTGFGAGGWESLVSSRAHDLGNHAPKMWSGALPNSDLLLVAVEHGVVALAVLATVFLLAVRASASSGDVSVLASLVVAGVLAVFDPQLVRPERVALLGVLLGAGTRSPRVATLRRASLVPLAIVALACALALLRVGSYAASSRIGIDRGAAGLERWAERHAVAERLFPRSSLAERRALVLALGDRCDDADEALRRFLDVHPHYWGARLEVARCFARTDRTEDARRSWSEALAAEPHLRELLARAER